MKRQFSCLYPTCNYSKLLLRDTTKIKHRAGLQPWELLARAWLCSWDVWSQQPPYEMGTHIALWLCIIFRNIPVFVFFQSCYFQYWLSSQWSGQELRVASSDISGTRDNGWGQEAAYFYRKRNQIFIGADTSVISENCLQYARTNWFLCYAQVGLRCKEGHATFQMIHSDMWVKLQCWCPSSSVDIKAAFSARPLPSTSRSFTSLCWTGWRQLDVRQREDWNDNSFRIEAGGRM